MRKVLLLLVGCALLAGCVPTMLSVYVPATGPTTETSPCGWTNVHVPMFDAEGVRIVAHFAPAEDHQGVPQIGMYAVNVHVARGTSVEFLSNDLEITSPELKSAIRLPLERLNSHYPIGTLVGPTEERLFSRPESAERPSEISVRLPELRINGTTTHPAAVALELRKRLALVWLCV